MKTVSIVIPNYRRLPLLKNLKSIIDSCPGCQVVVVDDASPDGAAAALSKKFPKVKVLKNKTNMRFAKACNQGVKHAGGDLVVLLNSDVIPQKDFLKPLLAHFKDINTFAVSCLETQIAKGKKQFSGKNICSFKRGLIVHSSSTIKDFKNPQTNCWASGGSMIFDRKKFLNLEGFDPLFRPAYWEDIDLSFRAKARGWKVLFEPRSKVFHQHETTNLKEFGLDQIKLISTRNQLLFVWKNIKGLKLLLHFIWLPYHFIFTNYRSNGIFNKAFFLALKRYLKNHSL